MRSESEEYFEGADDGACVEGDLREWDDSDEDGHHYGERAGVAGGGDQVGSNFSHDAVAKHEDACYGCCAVECIL